jgi:hypothetical protein
MASAEYGARVDEPNRQVSWSDRLGIYASATCVVHCIGTPILLSMSAVAAHFLPSEESTHRTLAVGVAFLGTIAIIRGLRRHRRGVVVWLMLAGLSCVAGAAYFGDALPHHWMEVGVTVCGSALMITAHRLNHTFCKNCSCACEP